MPTITITAPGTVLPVLIQREISDEQVSRIQQLLDSDLPVTSDVLTVKFPNLTGTDCGWIAITAAEGGIGYWSQIETYDYARWYPDGTDEPLNVPDDFVFYTIRYENPKDDTPPTLTSDITPDVIRRGFAAVLNGSIRKDLVAQAVNGIKDGDPGEVDADVADCAVQFGIFGEVVFG